MYSLITSTVLATLSVVPQSLAQSQKYTVWSSTIFSRTGERTPVMLGDMNSILTPLGANQSYTAGAFMRDRYFGDYSANGVPDVGGAPIQGLSGNTFDVDQVYIGCQDIQYTAASAQAFLQGFYPPLDQSDGESDQDNTTPASMNKLADGTTIKAPLDNYQYPLIQTYTSNSPEFVYIGASADCPAFDIHQENYEFSATAADIYQDSARFFQTIGKRFLGDVLGEEYWMSAYAWSIFDYVNYLYIHDSDAHDFLDQEVFVNPSNHITNIEQLRYYADLQLWGWYGNPYAVNNLTSDTYPAPYGSISTIAGNFIASQLLGQLQQAVRYKAEYYKLNLLFGDFASLMSLIALTDLPSQNPNFYGMANFASMAVFELFSYTDGSGNAPFPSEDELHVRFYFQNGTNDDYQSYPLFGQGPDAIDMTWSDFQTSMYQLVPGSDGVWCDQCMSANLFCAYWDATRSLTASEIEGTNYKVEPVVAGVIGALVALIVASLIFAAVMFFGRYRFQRTYSQKEMRGYKGSQKMASDKDLVLPKSGTVVTTEETPGSPIKGGHERVGSWELKQNEAGRPTITAVGATIDRSSSYEQDDAHEIGEAPWQKPVQPDERV